jgi:hypothetical protein
MLAGTVSWDADSDNWWCVAEFWWLRLFAGLGLGKRA